MVWEVVPLFSPEVFRKIAVREQLVWKSPDGIAVSLSFPCHPKVASLQMASL